MEDVIIDSSSLFLVLKTGELKEKLFDYVLDKSFTRRLLFSPLVFDEMLDHGDKNLVAEQLCEIGNIARKLGSQFGWALVPQDNFQLEVSSPVIETPVANEEIAKNYLSHFSDKKLLIEFVSDKGAEHQLWKSQRLEGDRKVNARARELSKENKVLSRDSVIKLIQEYRGTSIESPFLAFAIEENSGTHKNSIESRNVVDSPSRYPFLYAWACLADLTGLGNALPEDDSHEIAHRLRLDKGNWFDNSIGCAAALCKTLVTEDRGLIWKCNHLFKNGIIGVSAQSIEKLLAD